MRAIPVVVRNNRSTYLAAERFGGELIDQLGMLATRSSGVEIRASLKVFRKGLKVDSDGGLTI